jgi:hypothetical protein
MIVSFTNWNLRTKRMNSLVTNENLYTSITSYASYSTSSVRRGQRRRHFAMGMKREEQQGWPAGVGVHGWGIVRANFARAWQHLPAGERTNLFIQEITHMVFNVIFGSVQIIRAIKQPLWFIVYQKTISNPAATRGGAPVIQDKCVVYVALNNLVKLLCSWMLRPVSLQMSRRRLPRVTHHLKTFETIMKHPTLNA